MLWQMELFRKSEIQLPQALWMLDTAGLGPESSRNSDLFLRGASKPDVNKAKDNPRLDQIRKDDVLVAWKLDRLSRSLHDVLAIMDRLSEAGAGFAA